MKWRIVILFISFALFTLNIQAQKWKLTRYEAIFGIGTTNVFGDIGGSADKNNLWGLKDIRLKETGLCLYGGARYFLDPSMAIRLNLIGGLAKGTDVAAKNELGRNFSYNSIIFEPSVQYEYYFIKNDERNSNVVLYSRNGMVNNYKLITAYGFVGVGGLFFSPSLKYVGRQPDPKYEYVDNYSKFTAVIPFGLGAKMVLDRYWTIGAELGRRIVFSDYIDGLSTSYSHHNDTYYFMVIQAIYKLETDRYGVPLFLKRKRAPRR